MENRDIRFRPCPVQDLPWTSLHVDDTTACGHSFSNRKIFPSPIIEGSWLCAVLGRTFPCFVELPFHRYTMHMEHPAFEYTSITGCSPTRDSSDSTEDYMAEDSKLEETTQVDGIHGSGTGIHYGQGAE